MIRIERAIPERAEALSDVAFRAKSHWGYPREWLAIWRPALTLSAAYVRDNEVYAALSGDVVVGFYALEGRGATVDLDHLWIEPRWIGKGIGRALFEHALRRAASLGAARMTIESDPHAEEFYRHMGARRVGAVPAPVAGRPRELPLLIVELPAST